MKVLLVEDVREIRETLKNQIKLIPEITEIIESTSAEDALFMLFEHNAEIVFCSNNLPGRSGFDLAFLLQKLKHESLMIITSTDPSDALYAIRSKIFDFLLQPFTNEEISSSFKKAFDSISKNKSNYPKIGVNEKRKIRISSASGFLLLNIEELIYCVADGSYTFLYFNDGKTEYSSYYLGKIEKQLKDFNFIRINRSTIVNLKSIKQIDKKKDLCIVEFGTNEVKLKISKSKYKILEEEKII